MKFEFKKNKMQINEFFFQNLFMNIVLKKEEIEKKGLKRYF
jgi:hypothetical protein